MLLQIHKWQKGAGLPWLTQIKYVYLLNAEPTFPEHYASPAPNILTKFGFY